MARHMIAGLSTVVLANRAARPSVVTFNGLRRASSGREARLQVGAEGFCSASVRARHMIAGLSLVSRDGSSELPDLRRSPSVTMMQPAQHRNRDDPARLRRLDRPWLWSVFLKCQVRAIPMIIFQKSSKVTVQASLVEDDHVIQAFATDGTDHSFDIRSLPR